MILKLCSGHRISSSFEFSLDFSLLSISGDMFGEALIPRIPRYLYTAVSIVSLDREPIHRFACVGHKIQEGRE